MKKSLTHFICPDNLNILQALEKIDSTSKGTIFVVAKKTGDFIGTVTDGDIRRFIIAEKNLNSPISLLANKNCVTINANENQDEILGKIKSSLAKIRVIPILEGKKCIDYLEISPEFRMPISGPKFLGKEIEYVTECLQTMWISSQGKFIERFSHKFNELFNYNHSVPVMNGTCALQLALAALKIGPGDEVIVPALTFAATINSVIHAGATPVIVDIEEESWCIDPKCIETALSKKTKAIIPVHLFGQPSNMTEIMRIAKERKLKVIEDCAQAIGAKHQGQFIGSFGDISCFSFFANKIITTGEGGMCATNDKELFERMTLLRDHGRDHSHSGYYHSEPGFNYRMTNMQAGIGLAQLESFEKHLNNRIQLKQEYETYLKENHQLKPQSKIEGNEMVTWLVSFLLEHTFSRDKLVSKLKEHNIDARPFFIPLHKMPIYENYAKSSCPVADKVSEQGLSFPTIFMSKKDSVENICKIINQIVISEQ